MSTTTPQKIRWGILGYARIAREQVMPAIQRSDNSVLAALGSRDAAKLADGKRRFPELTTVHANYEAVIADPTVDAIYIPLPNALHREWTLRAIEAGKHVLCEKPMGLTAEETAEMIAAARRHGVKLMEAFMYRYTHRTQAMIEVVQSGVLGEIKYVASNFRFLLANPSSIKLRPELGGGALYDVGCYPVNVIGLIADLAAGVRAGGAVPDSVSGESVRAGGVDTAFSAALRYPSGLLASANCGFTTHGRIFSEIVGTTGVLEIPDTFLNDAGVLRLTAGAERREIPVPESDRYRAEIEDFAAAIQQNRDPLFPLEETQRNAVVIDRLIAAAG